MTLTLPDFCLVMISGTAGPAVSEFAARHFDSDEIVAHDDAGTIAQRLAARRLVAIAGPFGTAAERQAVAKLAKRHHADAVVIVLAGERAPAKPRHGDEARHVRDVEKLQGEGFRSAIFLRSGADADALSIRRVPTASDQRHDTGPFDIIGDVHGCADELVELMGRLGYRVRLEGAGAERRALVEAPPGRRAFFVGDLVDRGPNAPDVLRIVMDMSAAGQAHCVPGNHDAKFLRWLDRKRVTLTHGLDRTVAQVTAEPPAFHMRTRDYLRSLKSHAWLDGGRLAIAHAGIREDMIGRVAGGVREFCLYGDTDGTDERGMPIRWHWAAAYTGETAIVYGHTPVPEADWVNNTLCIDTGCCFGGRLTALRWPEREIVSVPARMQYAAPSRPLGHPPVRPT